MEEEKRDNKKAGMRRALNVRDILNKKYDVFPFEGKWKDAFDTPEVRGCWFVWGNSGNGKTSFVMQLCKELCKYDRVAFNSLEEGTSLTVQNNLRRFGMAEVSRHLAFIKEDIPTLKIRLRRQSSGYCLCGLSGNGSAFISRRNVTTGADAVYAGNRR